MKKFSILLVAALPLFMGACGDDNNETVVTLDKTTEQVNYGETLTLTANEKNCTWSTSDEFVATVVDGVVTPNHAGEAVITAEKNGSKASCKVTVVPTNDNFTMPLLWFGQSLNSVKTEMDKWTGLQNDPQESTDELAYVTIAGLPDGYPLYLYYFDENDALKESDLIITSDQFKDGNMTEFLGQRYYSAGKDEVLDGYVYLNALSRSEATIAAVVNLYDDGECDIWWSEVEHTKAGAYINAQRHQNARAARVALKK